jgi:hypothetical protein
MSPRALPPLLFLGLALLAGAPTACDGDGNPDVVSPTGGSGGGTGTGGNGGSSDSGANDASGDALVDGVAPDASAASVRVGVVPTPKSVDGGVTPLDEKLAHLEVISVGSRGVSLIRRWDALYDDPVTPAADAWKDLGDLSQLYRDADRRLLVCLALVDRTLDARPNGLGGWKDASTLAAVDALIDKTYATFGDELYALSFGNEVDRWLAKASKTDRADGVALLEHAVGYAENHPSKPAGALVGVSFGLDAVVDKTLPEVQQLIDASNAVVVSYAPLDASFQAKSPSTAASDLDALSQALAAPDAGDAGDAGEAGAPRPVLLQEIAYPSSPDAKSSEDQQRAFYDNLFQALSTRRDRFPFVVVRGLHDAAPAECAADAVALGVGTNPTAVAARCSLGLRTADGTGKAALSSVTDALATFAGP